jgi:extracellular elastinolytic metalloproteinase
MSSDRTSTALYAEGECDARNFSHRGDPGRAVAAAVGAGPHRMAGGAKVAIAAAHEFTGSPSLIRTEGEASDVPPVARALELVRRVTGELTRPGEVLEWLPDPRIYRTSAGKMVLHVHQHYRGVPVFEGMRTVLLSPSGSPERVTGDHMPMHEGLPFAPELDAPGAVLAAAKYLSKAVPGVKLEVTDHPPRILATHALPAEPTVLHKRPFDDPILAHLTFLYLGPQSELGWYIGLVLPELAGTWDLIVAARGSDAGRVLWCRETSSNARVARGLVFGSDPEDPAAQRARSVLDFPIPLDRLPALRPRNPLPEGFPHLWVTDQRTLGNNAQAKRFGDKALLGALQDGRVVFSPGDAASDDQSVLNAFYYCNLLHDLFYLLGFDETSGNFQEKNFAGSGQASDPLEVRIVDLVPNGDARFEVKADGKSPRVAFGAARSGRHTAQSADVVFHEVTHGLTERLVGGRKVPHPMQQGLHSRALDEGTCDWFALTVQHHAALGEDPTADERLVFGAWVANDAARGLRPLSYRDYPFGFGDLSRPELAEPHAAGQVWCAALLAMNRGIGAVVGEGRLGHQLGWQAVVDALKTMSKTPRSVTYLAVRDAIYEAVKALAASSPERADGSPLLPPDLAIEVEQAVRSAFGEFGMGDAARADGLDFANVVADTPAGG